MARITGSAASKYSMSPVSKARVSVQETGEIALTDERGHFALASVEQGRVSLICQADGYSVARAVVEADDSEGSYSVEFKLRPIVKAL